MTPLLNLTLLSALIAAIVMVQQRSHLMFLGAIAVVLTICQGHIRRVAAIAVAILAVYLVRDLVFGPAVAAYWDDLLYGDASSIRMDALRWAWDGFLDNPLGFGYGSFSLTYPALLAYPHNLVLEAAYELGLPGLILVTAVILRSICRFRHPTLITAIACFTALHLLKASDLAGMDMLWFALILSRPPMQPQPQPSHAPNPLSNNRNHTPPCFRLGRHSRHHLLAVRMGTQETRRT
jgi:O-antigen ligase